MSAGYELDTTTVRFTYSSMTTPAQVYDYDMETRARVLRKTQEVPSGHDPADYVTRRLHAPAPDGETVPVSLIYKKGTPLDGSAPLLPLRLRRLRHQHPAGVLHQQAVAGRSRLHLRRRPHPRRARTKATAGTPRASGEKKLNTFTDFVAAAEFLVQDRLHPARPHRRQRRLGRRHVDGRGCQHGARAVRRRSSPTCPSSTCSTPCSTRACR